ncbi:carbohydrate kinase family protein [Phytohabitans rumicis]|uniref:Ribokinase n=1 Tax=Phytohabitans rumicis TaxID=1076125 RepID=A0A6V8L4W5_9ACTN|nr:carbohydrate kinase [Phytohabitans rumicis]GFJ89861.1 ribokinase [Phytohabitans rumicis]
MAFLVVGESLVDLISRGGTWEFVATPGGSPLNVAVGLAAHDHEVRFATEVGTDLFGGLLREHLEKYGVAPTDLAGTDTTSVAFARIDETGAATYDFRFGWAYAGAPDLARISCLHTGSLATAVAPGDAAVLALIEAARGAGALVSYDPNIRPALVGDRATALARVEEIVRAADVVKVSDEDLRWLYPGELDVAVATRWAGYGPRVVVVTRGGQGAVGVHDGLLTVCAAPRITVADTVGAGDAFTAGLLSALGGDLTAESVARAMRYASATAAAVCARPGATPPPRAEIESLLPAAVTTTTPL